MVRSLALLCLVVLSLSCRPALPQAIQDELAQTPREQATVVFFTDFQCPFCRRTHAALAPLLAERRGRVRLVLRHVPLRRHPDAHTAARAAVCVESLAPDRLLDYAHALTTSYDLSERAVAELAVQHGVDRERFDRCTRDPATDERIARDMRTFDAVEGDGVPLLFVGRTRLEGSQTRSSLEPALDAAIDSAK